MNFGFINEVWELRNRRLFLIIKFLRPWTISVIWHVLIVFKRLVTSIIKSHTISSLPLILVEWRCNKWFSWDIILIRSIAFLPYLLLIKRFEILEIVRIIASVEFLRLMFLWFLLATILGRWHNQWFLKLLVLTILSGQWVYAVWFCNDPCCMRILLTKIVLILFFIWYLVVAIEVVSFVNRLIIIMPKFSQVLVIALISGWI